MTYTLASVTGRTEPAPVVEARSGVLLCVPIVTLGYGLVLGRKL